MTDSANASLAMCKMEDGLPIYGEPGHIYTCNEIKCLDGVCRYVVFHYSIFDFKKPIDVVEKHTWLIEHKNETFHLFISNLTAEEALDMMSEGDVVTDGKVIYFMTNIATYPKYNADAYIVTKPMDLDANPSVQCKVSEFADKFADRLFAIYQNAFEECFRTLAGEEES